jgi:hypothetical protein
MSHVPDVEQPTILIYVPSHHFLDLFLPKEVAFGEGAQNVVIDEFEYFLLLCILLQAGVFDVCVDHDKVFLPLAFEGVQLVLLVGGHILE